MTKQADFDPTSQSTTSADHLPKQPSLYSQEENVSPPTTTMGNLLQSDEKEIERLLREQWDIGRVQHSVVTSENEIQALISGSLQPQVVVAGQPRPDMAYHPDFVSDPTKDIHEYHVSLGKKTTHIGKTLSWYGEHLGGEKTGYLGSVPGTVFSHTEQPPQDDSLANFVSPSPSNSFGYDFAAPTTRLTSIITAPTEDPVASVNTSAQAGPQSNGFMGLLHENPSPAEWLQVEPTMPLIDKEHVIQQLSDFVLTPTAPLPPQPGSEPTDTMSRLSQPGQSEFAYPCPVCGCACWNSLLSCPRCRTPLRIGGDFQILRGLGQGSFGRVYQAEHLVEKYTCAIKILHPDLEHSPMITQFRAEERTQKIENIKIRFQREIDFMSQLSQHCDAVAKIYTHGLDPHFGPFVAMECLQGKTLEEFIPPYPSTVNPADALWIMLALCEAMDKIHRVSIWHRDLKPSNIFLEYNDPMGWALKIMDLGIAKSPALQSLYPNQTKLTQGLVGTVCYCSPEQIYNLPGLDHRTDLYSMGAIFYEMLTGEPPFLGDDPMQVCMAHIREEPKSLHKRRPDVDFPNGLNDVVLRALQKYPDKRYASALEFKEALLPFV